MDANSSVHSVVESLNENNLLLPVIFKPDIGERGFMVKRIETHNDIEKYLKEIKINFIAQALIDDPMEFGIFYTRFPEQAKGCVTSIVIKEMLSVTGNGTSSLQELIFQKDRAKLQWNILKEVHQHKLNQIIPAGEIFELVSIGNHCLGTKFMDGGHLINDKISETFDRISKQIEGFYFGRFDLRCRSFEDLYNGNVKIMELNGCGAEPAHIYQPGYPLLKALRVLFIHWQNIFLIARQNHMLGVQYTSVKTALRYYNAFKKATT
jgi:hypothetical protein